MVYFKPKPDGRVDAILCPASEDYTPDEGFIATTEIPLAPEAPEGKAPALYYHNGIFTWSFEDLPPPPPVIN